MPQAGSAPADRGCLSEPPGAGAAPAPCRAPCVKEPVSEVPSAARAARCARARRLPARAFCPRHALGRESFSRNTDSGPIGQMTGPPLDTIANWGGLHCCIAPQIFTLSPPCGAHPRDSAPHPPLQKPMRETALLGGGNPGEQPWPRRRRIVLIARRSGTSAEPVGGDECTPTLERPTVGPLWTEHRASTVSHSELARQAAARADRRRQHSRGPTRAELCGTLWRAAGDGMTRYGTDGNAHSDL